MSDYLPFSAASGHPDYALSGIEEADTFGLISPINPSVDASGWYRAYDGGPSAVKQAQQDNVLDSPSSMTGPPEVRPEMEKDQARPANGEVMDYEAEAAAKFDHISEQEVEKLISNYMGIKHEAEEDEDDDQVLEQAHNQNKSVDPEALNSDANPTFTTACPLFHKTNHYTDLETLPTGAVLLATHQIGQRTNRTDSILSASHPTAFALNYPAPPYMHAMICIHQWNVWAENTTEPDEKLRLQNWVRDITLQFLQQGGPLPDWFLAQEWASPGCLDASQDENENESESECRGERVPKAFTAEERKAAAYEFVREVEAADAAEAVEAADARDRAQLRQELKTELEAEITAAVEARLLTKPHTHNNDNNNRSEKSAPIPFQSATPITFDPPAANHNPDQRRNTYHTTYFIPQLNALFCILGRRQLRKPPTTWEKLVSRIRACKFAPRVVEDLGREFADGWKTWDGKRWEGLGQGLVEALGMVLRNKEGKEKMEGRNGKGRGLRGKGAIVGAGVKRDRAAVDAEDDGDRSESSYGEATGRGRQGKKAKV